jgi:hypothetical protein
MATDGKLLDLIGDIYDCAIRPDFEKSMMENMAINPLISMGWFANVDEPFTGEDVLGRESYLKTRFYNEIIAPGG